MKYALEMQQSALALNSKLTLIADCQECVYKLRVGKTAKNVHFAWIDQFSGAQKFTKPGVLRCRQLIISLFAQNSSVDGRSRADRAI